MVNQQDSTVGAASTASGTRTVGALRDVAPRDQVRAVDGGEPVLGNQPALDNQEAAVNTSDVRNQHKRPSSHRVIGVAAPLGLVVFVFAVWQLTCSLGRVPPSILPTPVDTIARLGRDLMGSRLLAATGVTLYEALMGCLLAASVSLPLAYLIAHSGVVEAATAPFVAASQAVPAVAIAPLLMAWFGIGSWPVILLCGVMVFFPMLLNTTLGFRQIPRDIIEAAMLDGAGRAQLLWHIEWPLARVATLTGLRNGFTLSITGAVVGEFVMGGSGLGMRVSVQNATSDTAGLFATIITLSALAIAVYFVMLTVERLANPLRIVGSQKPPDLGDR